MSDDYHLFDERADDGRPLDADLSLLTAYLADELSPVQVAAVERRLGDDPAFAQVAEPLVAAWKTPVPERWVGWWPVSGERPPATDAEVENGWRRLQAAKRAHVSQGRTRVMSRARAAAMVALVVGPLLAIAQGVRYVVNRGSDPAARVDIAASAQGGRLSIGGEPSFEGQRLAVLPRAGGQPERWRVEMTPSVDIGAPLPTLSGRAAGGGGAAGIANRVDPRDLTGPPELLRSIKDVIRLSDGRIVVGEFYHGLKFFDASGRFLKFLSNDSLGIPVMNGVYAYRGDSILVMTESGSQGGGPPGGMKFSIVRGTPMIFDSEGRLGRSVYLASPQTRANEADGEGLSHQTESGFQGSLADGSFVLRGTTVYRLVGTPGTRFGKATFFRLSADGSRVDTIATHVVADVEETGPRTPQSAGYVLPFFRMEAPRVALHGSAMYWGDGSQFELTVYDLSKPASGNPAVARIIKGAKLPAPATDSVRSAYIERLVGRDAGRGGAGAASSREMWRGRASRPVQPAFVRSLVDASGNLWLENFRASRPLGGLLDDPTDVPLWTVFDASGRTVGDVVLPRGLKVAAIGPDWVLGTTKDADGAEHVRIHRLVK